MTSSPVLFDYAGQQVRTTVIDGAPWFVAADVCRILAHSNVTVAMQMLEDDEKRLFDSRDSDIPNLNSVNPDIWLVSEPGVYELAFRSAASGAKKFKRWITHDVLPAIRRTGQFGSQVPGSFAEALELAASQQRSIEAAEAKIAIDAPKVAAYEQLMDADGYYDMGAAAKVLGIGRNTLFRRLRDEGILQTGSNLPYQRFAHHFKVTTAPYSTNDGSTHVSYTTRVRPTGLDYIARKLGITLVGSSEVAL
jgi:anti-repressor protein